MIIIYPTGTVTQFYGRNPTYYLKGAITLPTGPHGATNRDTYTVPAGRKAVITSMFCEVIRSTVAAPVGLVKAHIDVQQSGNSFIVLDAILTTNVANDNKQASWGGEIFLNAGDIVYVVTQDSGTGGTVGYWQAVNIVEYQP